LLVLGEAAKERISERETIQGRANTFEKNSIVWWMFSGHFFHDYCRVLLTT